MLNWIRKDGGQPDHPMRDPAAAAKLLAELRAEEPLAALGELGAWLNAVAKSPSEDERLRGEILGLIHDAIQAHANALLAQWLAPGAARHPVAESSWNLLLEHARDLAGARCASARVLLSRAAADPEQRAAAAAGAAGGLHAARLLAKVCLMRYQSVPPKLWRLAYAVHGDAERAGCAAMPVRLSAAQKTATTATRELLCLLMLQSSAPELMAPEQIEVADRAIEQFAGEFTLRPRGAADVAFCFDPDGDRAPRRAPAGAEGEARYFGPGTALDALERLYKQLASARSADLKPFGKDLASHAQLSAMQHLLAFWGERSPYSPPDRLPATGTLRVVRGYGHIWQHLSSARAASAELTLLEEGETAPQPPEAWSLRDAGGNELGADLPTHSGVGLSCGDVIGMSMEGGNECWLGIVRSLHTEPGRGLHAKIFVLSRAPRAVQLLPQPELGDDNVYSGEAAKQFNFKRVLAIIVSDGAGGTQVPNLLLPPEHWRAGRVYEVALEGGTRELRGLELLRQRDEYARCTFDWVA